MMTEPNNIQIPYEDMLKAGMHFGRKRTVFNPAMERYVFTVRDGICIIDLLKTQAQLNNSIEFLKKTINPPAGGRGLVLFVSLTKQSSDKVKELAESLNMPYVLDRWLGGTLTNLRVISDRIKKLEEMEQAQKRENSVRQRTCQDANEVRRTQNSYQNAQRHLCFVFERKRIACPRSQENGRENSRYRKYRFQPG